MHGRKPSVCWSLLFSWLLLAVSWSSARAAPADDSERNTPRRATAAFLAAAERADQPAILAALEVPAHASAERKSKAAELGRQLASVLSKSPAFDLDAISDEPTGTPADGADSERIAVLRTREREVPIVLERSKLLVGDWVFSPGTQARVPELYARYGPSPLEAHVPRGLRREVFGVAYWQWLGLLVAVAAGALIGRAVAYVLNRLSHRLAVRTRMLWDDELVHALHPPVRLFLSVLAFVPFAHALSLPGAARLVCIRAARTLVIVALAWAAIRIARVISNLVERRAIHSAEGDATLSARAARTQVRVLRRVINVIIAVCAGAVVLLQFEVIRSVGVSLLASAGVAGLVIGLAAQRTLGSIVAGIQLSITQPIRIGDDVIVESEFGTIEEITLTYVVVRVWDERRLIVPMTRFLEQPFQNWTKVSSQLHGTVLLYADFTLPVDALRAELERLLEGNPRWDRRTRAVHVTEARERTLEIRVLVSAQDGGKLFDLRSELREKLIAWLARLEDGRYLPKVRCSDAVAARAPV
jgi:small-conductance mechanosensitive channel